DCNPNNDPAGGTLLVNIGKSRVSGMDLELSLVPVDNLTLDFAFSYLDTETRKYDAPPAIAPFIVDNEIPFNYTTDKTYSIGVRYALPLSGGLGEELLFNVDHYWTNDLNYTDTMVPSYHLTHMRVDLKGINRSRLDLGIFVRNLTDEEYNTTANASGAFIGMTSMIYGAPRMYGAELRYTF
ncbi:MAG: TonB-dependent receptor, partial [Porticoccaceae bacterium]